mmetsp:Transcript_11925/g.44355  ORF Transcript_11925/g.44355 Transcript_11925/m.44355 type:complete len:384 (-) Transcript_11925:1601-2752(-)
MVRVMELKSARVTSSWPTPITTASSRALHARHPIDASTLADASTSQAPLRATRSSTRVPHATKTASASLPIANQATHGVSFPFPFPFSSPTLNLAVRANPPFAQPSADHTSVVPSLRATQRDAPVGEDDMAATESKAVTQRRPTRVQTNFPKPSSTLKSPIAFSWTHANANALVLRRPVGTTQGTVPARHEGMSVVSLPIGSAIVKEEQPSKVVSSRRYPTTQPFCPVASSAKAFLVESDAVSTTSSATTLDTRSTSMPLATRISLYSSSPQKENCSMPNSVAMNKAPRHHVAAVVFFFVSVVDSSRKTLFINPRTHLHTRNVPDTSTDATAPVVSHTRICVNVSPNACPRKNADRSSVTRSTGVRPDAEAVAAPSDFSHSSA